MKVLSVLFLSAGVAFAAEPDGTTNGVAVVDSLSQTNNAEVAEAVEAMVVKEN